MQPYFEGTIPHNTYITQRKLQELFDNKQNWLRAYHIGEHLSYFKEKWWKHEIFASTTYNWTRSQWRTRIHSEESMISLTKEAKIFLKLKLQSDTINWRLKQKTFLKHHSELDMSIMNQWFCLVYRIPPQLSRISWIRFSSHFLINSW